MKDNILDFFIQKLFVTFKQILIIDIALNTSLIIDETFAQLVFR